MAHIVSINIEGLLGRKESIKIDLNRGVNVFFGENGCGKTTLLKVLDAAMSLDSLAMVDLPVSKVSVDIYSISYDKKFRHVWERSNNFSEKMISVDDDVIVNSELARIIAGQNRVLDKWKILSPNKETKRISKWAHSFLPTSRLYSGDLMTGGIQGGRQNISEEDLDKAFAESINRHWLKFYSAYLADVRGVQEEGLRAALLHVLGNPDGGSIQTNHDIDLVYQRVASFLSRQNQSTPIALGSFEDFKIRYLSDQNLRRIVDNLDEVECRIEKIMLPVKRFSETISSLFSNGKSINFSENKIKVMLDDERDLSVGRLSSGEKHLVKILLSCMTAGPNTILIDEPELSMHIDWQRKLPTSILALNPECQLIMASHSPEIMSEVADECIFKI